MACKRTTRVHASFKRNRYDGRGGRRVVWLHMSISYFTKWEQNRWVEDEREEQKCSPNGSTCQLARWVQADWWGGFSNPNLWGEAHLAHLTRPLLVLVTASFPREAKWTRGGNFPLGWMLANSESLFANLGVMEILEESNFDFVVAK